ncbi:archaemetzincin family Zn-dependent metalloprotease [bacterium]|nr:archaemetzincin family Zn-dependent metalloprotease [bacterium]
MRCESMTLIPISDMDSDFLSKLGKDLSNIYFVRITIEEALQIPYKAYHPDRDQYNATRILETIYSNRKNDNKLLAITDKDLYSEGFNFVFGEADIVHGIAIISLTRLDQTFYGLQTNLHLFYQRALKEAVHEAGHLYHLRHCANQNCVMYFSNSLMDTDRKSHKLCKTCLKKTPIIVPFYKNVIQFL